MIIDNEIGAPVLDRYIMEDCWEHKTVLTKKSKAALDKLVEAFRPIEPKEAGDNWWKVWFQAARGPIEKYGTFEELQLEGYIETYEEYLADWQKSYPTEVNWYRLTVVRRNGTTALWLNDSMVINQDLREEKENTWPNTDCEDLLEYLTRKVERIVEMIRAGTYNDFVEKYLPYKLRHGTAPRQAVWKLFPQVKEYDLGNLTADEITEFDSIVGADEHYEPSPAFRLKELSAGKYFDLCALCYKAAGYQIWDDASSIDLYKQYADDRDGGLRNLPLDNVSAFSDWFNHGRLDREYFADNSHLWEISMGHTHTMIHLYVGRDEGGFYLELCGGSHTNTSRVVKMFLALYHENIPIGLYFAQQIANKVTGRDLYGIVRVNESGWRYWYGGFDIKGLVSFMNLNDVENGDQLIHDITLVPIEKVNLAINPQT